MSDAVKSLCCDCIYGDGQCCDYSENETCERRKEDGSCWKPYNAGQWISVKDRLPDEEQDVLVLVEEIEVYGKHDERKHKWNNIFVGYCDDGNWLTSYCFGCEYISKVNDDFEARNDKSRVKVTHWMPLPEPPKGDNDDED